MFCRKVFLSQICSSVSETYRRSDSEVVLVNTSDVLDGTVINRQLVPNKNLKGQFKKTFRKDDILYSEIRPANRRFAFVDFEQTSNYVASTKLMVIRANPSVVLPKYLFYVLTSPETINYLQTRAETRSGTFPQITFLGEVGPIEIDLPDLCTQRRIVSVLESIDGKITNNSKINGCLLEQLAASYAHFSKQENWPIKTIGEIAERVAMGPFGSNIKVSTFVDSGVPVVSGNHLRGYFLDDNDFNYISVEHAERLKNSKVRRGDIVFTHAGNIGQVSLVPNTSDYSEYMLSQRQFFLRCDRRKTIPEYVLFFFHSGEGQHELLSYANQTGVPSIAQPASNLKKIHFRCPPIEMQQSWMGTINPLIEKYLITCLEIKRLTILRDTLLPKLMSGEIDINSINID